MTYHNFIKFFFCNTFSFSHHIFALVSTHLQSIAVYFLTFFVGTSGLLNACPDLLKKCEDTQSENNGESCNKDTGKTQRVLLKWPRGLSHHVCGGGYIDKWNPIYVQVSLQYTTCRITATRLIMHEINM